MAFDDDFVDWFKLKAQQARVNEQHARMQEEIQGQPRYTEAERRERSLMSIMSRWTLKPGQMLLLGPISVEILGTGIGYQGPKSLPDVFIFEKPEWTGKPDADNPTTGNRNRARRTNSTRR